MRYQASHGQQWDPAWLCQDLCWAFSLIGPVHLQKGYTSISRGWFVRGCDAGMPLLSKV